jgi:hypothetical protein
MSPSVDQKKKKKWKKYSIKFLDFLKVFLKIIAWNQPPASFGYISKQEQRKRGIIRPSIFVKNNKSIPLKSELDLQLFTTKR